MKKKFVIGLLSLMIIASLAGCGSSSTSSASTTTVEATEATTEDNFSIKTDWTSMAEVTFSEDGMTIEGSGCSDESGVLYITEGGAYTLTGTSTSATILINTDENVKLILNGVDLTSENGPVIYGSQVKNLYIELAEGTTNTLADSNTYATDSSTGEEIGKGVISCEDDIVILGEGTLNVNANHKHGISSDDKIYIEAGTINIVSTGTDGINANDLIQIDGGTIDITSASDIMECEGVININGGIITGSSDDEGIEAKDSIYINGGNIDITVMDDGLNAANYIEINGGTITIVSSKGDAVDCNGGYDGCITINGGVLDLTGAQMPEGALDADEATVIINGGQVTATGGCNSPIQENGGENNITGETFSGGQGGGPAGGGPGGQGGPGGDFNPDDLPEDFDPANMPENMPTDFDPSNMPNDFNPENNTE